MVLLICLSYVLALKYQMDLVPVLPVLRVEFCQQLGTIPFTNDVWLLGSNWLLLSDDHNKVFK